jgi:glyoxylase-like metal-dependent hydrolase (beta-lactamase superfamily II)
MLNAMNRRSFLQLGLTAGAAAVLTRGTKMQAATRVAEDHASAATTPIKTTKLYDNVYLLQGEGGNMVLQTGAEGNTLIDASFAPAVPRILEAIAAVSKDAPFMLLNTHWHSDHTGGNEGLHAAGFTITAHENTRKRMAVPQVMKAFRSTTPASPAGALPTVTFNDAMNLWRNGDKLNLVHFAPAHTDTDIYVHFYKADVLHLGDIWFNGMYPFIDEGTGGSIGGMIRACDKALAVAGPATKLIPGHGALGTKTDFEKYREMLVTVRDRVAAQKKAGVSEQETLATKPTAEFDAVWGKGFMNPETFIGIVYRTL